MALSHYEFILIGRFLTGVAKFVYLKHRGVGRIGFCMF